MAVATFPTGYSSVSDPSTNAAGFSTGGSSEMPMVGFHAVQVRQDKLVVLHNGREYRHHWDRDPELSRDDIAPIHNLGFAT